jgi:hypothetical protein
MLGGTAYSLSWLPVLSEPTTAASWFLVPLVMHFGWTTAATLVNLNGSVAMESSINDSLLVGLGHGSVVAATALGVALPALGVAASPAYGLTIAWALLAVGSNAESQPRHSDVLRTGAKVHKALCYAGSAICVAASAFAMAQ